jgi:hypothetical protein
MKKLIFLSTIIFLTINTFSQSNSYLKEFLDGNTSKFICDGTGKCLGLKFSIKYPHSWTGKEGNRPHIIQKFREWASPVMAMIIVDEYDHILSTSEVNQVLSQESIKLMVSDIGQYISSNSSVKLDGIPAASMEYTAVGENDGVKAEMHFLSYMIVYKKWQVFLQFSVSDVNLTCTLSEKFEQNRALFKMIANSFVIISQWE